MLFQIFQDSIAVLRKPNIESFKAHGKNDLTWPIIYFAIGSVVSVVLQIIRIPMQQAYFEQQQAQLRQLNGNSFFTNLSSSAQSPSIIILLGLFGFILNLVMWIVMPYVVGRVLGGKGSFGQVAYNNSLVNVPLGILDGLISFGITTPLSCLFLILSLSLDGMRLYLTSVGTQAAMGLEERGDFWKLLVAIFLAVVIGIGISLAVAAGLVALGIGR